MMRKQVRILLPRNGPFDVHPMARLYRAAGIDHAWDIDMSRTDLGGRKLVRLPVLGKYGMHGRIRLAVGFDRREDRVDRRIANRRGADRQGDRGEAADADDTGAGGNGDKASPRRVD